MAHKNITLLGYFCIPCVTFLRWSVPLFPLAFFSVALCSLHASELLLSTFSLHKFIKNVLTRSYLYTRYDFTARFVPLSFYSVDVNRYLLLSVMLKVHISVFIGSNDRRGGGRRQETLASNKNNDRKQNTENIATGKQHQLTEKKLIQANTPNQTSTSTRATKEEQTRQRGVGRRPRSYCLM